tara:strand:+ start:1627 stop:3156 length:1530 start_codon:yes stop_codon:yes gene_type:complete
MFVLSVHSSLVKYFSYKVALLALVFTVYTLSASIVFAGSLSLSPASGTYSVGQTFTVSVQADPAGQSINSSEATITFDSAALSVVSLSKGSAFTLWTTEPTFSNTAGTISYGGGNPGPISSRSTIITITFRAKAEGTGSVAFENASLLAADGRGTDVLDSSPGGSYTITAGAQPEPTPDPEPTPTPEPEEDTNAAIAFGDPPRAPEIGSQAFLDPELWYDSTDGVFTWELPFDVSAVAAEIATSSENEPSEVFDPPIEEFVVSDENLSDGVQYLSIQFENQVGWGAVTNRIIKIDTTAPKPFDIAVQAGTSQSSFPLLVFEAEDETSGIELYKMVIADQEPIEITPGQAKLGYLLGKLEDGTYTVTVTARDMAGNETVSSVPVLITAGWLPDTEEEEKIPWWMFFTGTNLVIIILLLVAAGEFGYIIYERKEFAKKEAKLRKETREIQDQMEKIFSALRDEIYDQVNAITKRPRLSAKEKEAVEGLNQALEVSETLIEKEINDVKKILK